MLTIKKFLNANHVMIDIETMGTAPDAPILQLAAVKFRLDRGDLDAYENCSTLINDRFNTVCVYDKYIWDRDTLQWWMEDDRRRLILQYLISAGSPIARSIYSTLIEFTSFLASIDEPYIWAHPSFFDIPIIVSAYHSQNLELPPNFLHPASRRILCSSTIRNLLPVDWRSPAKDKAKHRQHNALWDCFIQIETLQAMLRDVISL